MKADDYGCFHGHPKLIRAACFPLKDSVRDTDISRWLAECEKAGVIRVYQVDGKPYVEIVDFGQRLRDTRRKFPDPNAGCGNPPQIAARRGKARPESEVESESETNTPKPPKPETSPDGSLDEGCSREKTREPLGEEAEEIYSFYPRKQAKPKAIEAIRKSLKKVAFEELRNKTEMYAEARAGQNPAYTPMPATWFNQERYNDDPATWLDRDSLTKLNAHPPQKPIPSGDYRPEEFAR